MTPTSCGSPSHGCQAPRGNPGHSPPITSVPQDSARCGQHYCCHLAVQRLRTLPNSLPLKAPLPASSDNSRHLPDSRLLIHSRCLPTVPPQSGHGPSSLSSFKRQLCDPATSASFSPTLCARSLRAPDAVPAPLTPCHVSSVSWIKVSAGVRASHRCLSPLCPIAKSTWGAERLARDAA